MAVANAFKAQQAAEPVMALNDVSINIALMDNVAIVGRSGDEESPRCTGGRLIKARQRPG